MNPTTTPTTSTTVAIIGTGFGGLGMAIKLKQAGIPFTIFEKEDAVGGCWRDNHYPGAACDVPSHLYSYSFEPSHNWSRRFAPQAEIHAYLVHCATKYGLLEHIRFNTEITGADFDEHAAVWRLRTSTGQVVEARALVSACGQLNRPAIPRVEGVETFEGPAFHSARWDHDLDLTGKTVAVIGTGASAIQFVPEIAPHVAKLHLFQRSAPYVVPKPDRAYRVWKRRLYKRLPGLQRLSRGAKYTQLEQRAVAMTKAPALMAIVRRAFERNLRNQVADPELRAKLRPSDPIGCKRVLLSNDWYPALTRDNVEVVSDDIVRVTPRGIVTADGIERPVDVIIYGTGFKATEFLAPMQITGLSGQSVNDAWRDGAEAYLGVTVTGFPNLFLLYGPNTNLGHNSIVYMLESQIHYAMQAIKTLTDAGARMLDVRPERQAEFNVDIQKLVEGTVWSQGCNSWYQTASGRNTNNWPGFTFAYRRRTRRLQLADYQVTA